MKRRTLSFHAIQSLQGNSDLFVMFMQGSMVLEIADLARLGQSDKGEIQGFQRPEIRAHIRDITEYLERGNVLFPNAIILALAPGVKFRAKRGTKNQTSDPAGTAGTLSISLAEGAKAAWIVDGQQRAIALSKSKTDVSVPVVAFVSGDIATHREQFVLVNKAQPLDRRLIDELLPLVGAILPRDLSSRRVPSALCDVLNRSDGSPFRRLIRRPSGHDPDAVITDSGLVNVMRRSLQDPRGALAALVAPDGTADLNSMYETMVGYWSAVRDVFPRAWGRPPDESRLMHTAGIGAMGVLMDQILARSSGGSAYDASLPTLKALEPRCHWTSGRWETLDREWNDIQSTTRDIRLLSNHLVALERDLHRAISGP